MYGVAGKTDYATLGAYSRHIVASRGIYRVIQEPDTICSWHPLPLRAVLWDYHLSRRVSLIQSSCVRYSRPTAGSAHPFHKYLPSCQCAPGLTWLHRLVVTSGSFSVALTLCFLSAANGESMTLIHCS